MSRSRRRLMAFWLAVVLLSTTGCAISSSARDGDGKTVLTFWHYFDDAQKVWLDAQIATFEQANPGVLVEGVQVVGSQQDQKLLASVATGASPDLFINNIVVDFPTLVSGGTMLDLTSYWESFPDKDKFPENATWESDGRIYNLMTYTNLIGMYYNKDILDEYGIAPPTTLDELQQAMDTVMTGGKYSGIALSGAPTVEGAWLFFPQLLGLGIDYCNLDASRDQVTAAFERVGQWRSNDALPRAAATWNQSAAWQQFITGRYAFAFNGNWNLGNAGDAGFDYGTAQFPAPPNGTSQVFPGGEGFAIGSQSKHPDVAWKFLQQLLSAQAGEGIYTEAGSIPLNQDAAQAPALADDQLVAPFVAAAQDTAEWPNNPNTASMQAAMGEAISGLISGALSPQAGAQSAITAIDEAKQSGGGGCA